MPMFHLNKRYDVCFGADQNLHSVDPLVQLSPDRVRYNLVDPTCTVF
jgi:hypothetical protein